MFHNASCIYGLFPCCCLDSACKQQAAKLMCQWWEQLKLAVQRPCCSQAWQTHWHRDPNLILLNHLQRNQVLGIYFFYANCSNFETKNVFVSKVSFKTKGYSWDSGKTADRVVADPCGMCHKGETAALILSKNTWTSLASAPVMPQRFQGSSREAKQHPRRFLQSLKKAEIKGENRCVG